MFLPRLLISFVAACVAATAFAAQPQRSVALDVSWQNNLSNAQRAGDHIEAWGGAATLRHRTVHRLPGNHTLAPEWHGRIEWFPEVTGLSAATLGGAFGWQHKFGLGNRPTLAASAGAAGILTRESARQAGEASGRVALSQRLTSSLRAEGSADLLRRAARETVFDRTVRRGTVQPR